MDPKQRDMDLFLLAQDRFQWPADYTSYKADKSSCSMPSGAFLEELGDY